MAKHGGSLNEAQRRTRETRRNKRRNRINAVNVNVHAKPITKSTQFGRR